MMGKFKNFVNYLLMKRQYDKINSVYHYYCENPELIIKAEPNEDYEDSFIIMPHNVEKAFFGSVWDKLGIGQKVTCLQWLNEKRAEQLKTEPYEIVKNFSSSDSEMFRIDRNRLIVNLAMFQDMEPFFIYKEFLKLETVKALGHYKKIYQDVVHSPLDCEDINVLNAFYPVTIDPDYAQDACQFLLTSDYNFIKNDNLKLNIAQYISQNLMRDDEEYTQIALDAMENFAGFVKDAKWDGTKEENELLLSARQSLIDEMANKFGLPKETARDILYVSAVYQRNLTKEEKSKTSLPQFVSQFVPTFQLQEKNEETLAE